MKRLVRRPGHIETLNFHAAVDVPVPGEQRLVSDPSRVAATVAEFEAGLRESLDTPSRIRGWMSDQFFGLIAADLGGCKLVKQEDSGVLFYEGEVKLPDWRLTLSSNANILVEVKAEGEDYPRVTKLRPSEADRLRHYAKLNDCPLYVAIHWVTMGMWTLVPIDDFTRVGGHIEIDLETAHRRNHMGFLLKDRVLGLVPPLEFRMTMEEAPHRASAKPNLEADDEEESRQVSLVVTSVGLFAGGKEMLDEREKALVWFLIQHARWPCDEDLRETGDGVWEMVFTMAPDQALDDQGFSLIGWLSELYTRMFYSGTSSLETGTTKLSIDLEPGTLPRLVPTDLKSDRLPLWHLHIRPSGPAGDGDDHGT